MQQQVIEELHKPAARRNYRRRKVIVRGLDEMWQADLMGMQPYSRENNGYKYMLTVIDVFSKYLWAVPVKQTTVSDVTVAMESILQQGRKPKNLQTDRGKEFYNTKLICIRHTAILRHLFVSVSIEHLSRKCGCNSACVESISGLISYLIC